MRTIKHLLRTLGSTFLKGLGSVLPLLLTLYLLYWLLAATEDGLGTLLRKVLPESAYIPGLGLAVGIATVLVVGFLANAWGFRSLLTLAGSLVERIPVVKSIYGALRDFVQFVSTSNDRKFNKVVRVTVAPNCRVIGFVTRENAHEMIDAEPGDEKLIAVYMPMSYQVGGYTAVIPESMTEPIDMSIEDAMRTVLTGGVSTSAAKSGPGRNDPGEKES